MSTGFTAPERAKAKQTRTAKRNATIGTITPDAKATLRARIAAGRKGNSSEIPVSSTTQENLTVAPIPAERALVVVVGTVCEPSSDTPAPFIPPRHRLIAHAIHQQHLNHPPMHVCSEAQRTRRLMAARNPKPAPNPTIIKLFPPATLINGISALEAVRSLARGLDVALRQGNVEKADYLRSQIQRYAENNQAAGSTIWFKVNAFGSRVDIRHWVYDPDTNRLEQYFGGRA